MHVLIARDADELAEIAADVFRERVRARPDLAMAVPAGRTPRVVRLPAYKDVFEAEKAGGSSPFRVDAVLPEGPRWVAKHEGGVAAGPFVVGDNVFVATEDGRRVETVHLLDGELADTRTLGHRPERVRLMGRGPAGTWIVQGQRTFGFLPDAGGTITSRMPRMRATPAACAGPAPPNPTMA